MAVTLEVAELARVAQVIGPRVNRLAGESALSSFHEGFDPEREAAMRNAFFSEDSVAARTMLQEWSSSPGPRTLTTSQHRGLVMLLIMIEGPNRAPGGLRKGLAVLGFAEDDGAALYQVRRKLESSI